MSARGIKILKKALRSVIKDNRKREGQVVGTLWRASLKGSAAERSAVCRQVEEWLSAIRLEKPECRPLPNGLIRVVSEIRKSAMDIRLTATTRRVACGRLLRIEGFTVAPRGEEPTDKLLDQFYGKLPEPPPPTYVHRRVRDQNRRRALDDVRAALISDIETGRIRNLDEAVVQLRLPEMEAAPLPAPPSLAEQNRDVIDAAVNAFKNA